MLKDYVIKVDETDNTIISETIKQGVVNFNAHFFGAGDAKPILVYIEIDHKVLGGIKAYYKHQYMRVDLVWVDEKYRRQGFGSKLMHRLEMISLEKSCTDIVLDTFDFQAKPFYEKLGFICVGTIENWIAGHACHFMRKILLLSMKT